MEKWLKERVLHRYVLENYKKYTHNGMKIIQVKDNKDQYPDLFCILENGKEVPVEVEWKSSNFVQHGHDINFIRENQGFLFVCSKDQDLGYDVPQYLLQTDDFEKWFESHAKEIARDTLIEYKEEAKAERVFPKLWFTYLSLKAGGIEHFEVSLKRGVWGVQEGYSGFVINQISSIQKGDIIAFIGPGRGFRGRVDLKTWSKRAFTGKFERVRLYRVAKGYYFDRTHVWKGARKWTNETFPHRFDFNPHPILDLKNVPINKLSMTAKTELHSMVYNNLIPANPSSMIDLIFYGEPATKDIEMLPQVQQLTKSD